MWVLTLDLSTLQMHPLEDFETAYLHEECTRLMARPYSIDQSTLLPDRSFSADTFLQILSSYSADRILEVDTIELITESPSLFP